jgi:hypothetical protein
VLRIELSRKAQGWRWIEEVGAAGQRLLQRTCQLTEKRAERDAVSGRESRESRQRGLEAVTEVGGRA